MEDRNLRNELLEFREKWRNEIKRNQNNIDLTLQTSPLTSHDTVRTSIRNNISGLDNNQNQESVLQVEFDRVNLNDETVQEKEIELHKAKMLYQQGIESERNGNCDAAVHYYREAIRLKPDIENCLEIEEFPGNQACMLLDITSNDLIGIGNNFNHNFLQLVADSTFVPVILSYGDSPVISKVLSLTSSAEPTTIIPQFYRRKAAGSSTASLGYYTLTNDTVSIVVNSSPKRRSKMDKPQSQTTFTMEFTLSKPRKKFNWYLSWSKFSYQSTNRFLGRVDTGNFEINKSYTPLYFSRVKSYSIATNSLLS
ncbi:uncharacterized protein TRIADDRAFT_58926 [Trichoplax adhaerens]|uniref:Uncharacterized protein n=1 Tax=Trichoplax adhaerens TaxID=10228 RepID=B3S422_TRIAD|nr:hypothetical protein TRIADDRAFT_58926 [Trichoplax adhaerens]EDV22564.1 hypothetical protein TRIADDRAFT_58926 [Trichoplax adhaerens]|eukprot:XP_002115108.1 hypothetical protein TRIADDRAFT_58926 [Trichoplax adhaerens]